MLKNLQEVTDLKIMSFYEAIKSLDWEFVSQPDDCFTVNCDCGCGGSKISYSGFIGTEVIECENCGKRVVDMFSPIPISSGSCSVLNPTDFDIDVDEEGFPRFWIAIDSKGGIKNV